MIKVIVGLIGRLTKVPKYPYAIPDDVEEFWFIHYQKRAVRKLLKTFNTSKLLPYSQLLVPNVKLPWNTSRWIKQFDEIFEELKEGEPLVAPELFKKQKLWWIQNRKRVRS